MGRLKGCERVDPSYDLVSLLSGCNACLVNLDRSMGGPGRRTPFPSPPLPPSLSQGKSRCSDVVLEMMNFPPSSSLVEGWNPIKFPVLKVRKLNRCNRIIRKLSVSVIHSSCFDHPESLSGQEFKRNLIEMMIYETISWEVFGVKR